jgi:hypothetical protein
MYRGFKFLQYGNQILKLRAYCAPGFPINFPTGSCKCPSVRRITELDIVPQVSFSAKV